MMDMATPLAKVGDTVISLEYIVHIAQSEVFKVQGYAIPLWAILLVGGLLYSSWREILEANSLQALVMALLKSPFVFLEGLIEPVFYFVLLILGLGVLWVVYTYLGAIAVLIIVLIAIYFFMG